MWLMGSSVVSVFVNRFRTSGHAKATRDLPWFTATAVLILLVFLSSSCAENHFPYRRNQCVIPEVQLAEAWERFTEARSDPAGCVPDEFGYDRCAEARKAVQTVAYVCPDYVPAIMATAIIAYEEKQYPRAQQILDSLFSLQKVHPEAAVLRGRIALEEGNLPFALRFLSEQVKISADHAELREVYAAALFLSGRLTEAKAQLDMAAHLGAPAWRVAYHLGLFEESQGHLDKARRYYEQAIRDNPGWSDSPSARLNGLRALQKANDKRSPALQKSPSSSK